MTKFLTIMAVLTAVATPALAQYSANQYSANRDALAKYRTQVERSIPGQSWDELHAGGGF
jgi:hypothetical protein